MAHPYQTVKTAVRSGVAVSRFRITKEQAEEIRRIERENGKSAATARLLQILWPKTEPHR